MDHEPVPIPSDLTIAAHARAAIRSALAQHATEHPTHAPARVEILARSPQHPTGCVLVETSHGGRSWYPLAGAP